MTPARNVEGRILCGRQYPTGHWCQQELAQILPAGEFDNQPEPWVIWRSAWHFRNDGVLVSGGGHRRAARGFAPTRRGSVRVISGEWRRQTYTWPLPLKARCPACGLVQNLDADLLR